MDIVSHILVPLFKGQNEEISRDFQDISSLVSSFILGVKIKNAQIDIFWLDLFFENSKEKQLMLVVSDFSGGRCRRVLVRYQSRILSMKGKFACCYFCLRKERVRKKRP